MTSKDAEQFMKLIALVPNVDIIVYHAEFLDESGKSVKLPAKECRLAVNTEMDQMWQLECHLITKHKMKSVLNVYIKGSLTKV